MPTDSRSTRSHATRLRQAMTCTSRRMLVMLAGLCILAGFTNCGTTPVLIQDPQDLPNNNTNDDATQDDASDVEGEDSVDDALDDNAVQHDAQQGCMWDDSTATHIVLDGDSVDIDGTGAVAHNSGVTISSPGTYVLTGTLWDGQILVDAADNADGDYVTVVLDGVDIENSTSAPLYVANAEAAVVVLAEGTQNHLTDGDSYVPTEADSDEPNATLFSEDPLTICGSGQLVVSANYNDAIASKDGLVVRDATIDVTSADDGLRGKDYVVVEGGEITVNASGDGVKSDDDSDDKKGYISIESGTLTITSTGDGLDATTDVLISGGDLTIVAGGGSGSFTGEAASAKGIVGGVHVIVADGVLDIDAADDAIHTNGSLAVAGGSIVLSTGDDGLHADSTLEIEGGDIDILDAYEGIESGADIIINGGTIHIACSDDGLNIASGLDGSGMRPWDGHGGESSTGNLYINGGYVYVNADGDGLDINGNVVMSAGTVIISGPTSNNNGALDHHLFDMSGGFLWAVGSAGMAMTPDTTSDQYSVSLTLNRALDAGTLVHIETASGEAVVTATSAKQFQSIVFSSADLQAGTTYYVYYGGDSTGVKTDQVMEGGTYTGGSELTSFTASSTVTRIGR